jgi:dTDP-4-dehydrorhamnose reductase
MLGWTLCTVAGKSWHTFGAACHNLVVPADVSICRVDITDQRSVMDLMASIKPDAVIHAAALSSPDYCEEHPRESQLVNVTASRHVAQACAADAIPCAFISSDLVFDGEHAPYNEESPAMPVSVYGQHKLLAENAVRADYPRTTVCRLPLLFGIGSPAREGSFLRMLRSMRAGEEVRLFTDEIRTPVSTETAADGILRALDHAPGDTVHLGGQERVSRWELGLLAAEILIGGKPRLIRCSQAEVASPAPRPRDVSLENRLSARIGYFPKTVREQMFDLLVECSSAGTRDIGKCRLPTQARGEGPT